MKLVLTRQYFPHGTNAVLSINGNPICATIELPWKNNEHGISCIPHGEYVVVKRTSDRHHEHLWVTHVPNRDLILIHPANDAEHELRGCIAPVSFVTGEGTGDASVAALRKLMAIVNALPPHETISLLITPAP